MCYTASRSMGFPTMLRIVVMAMPLVCTLCVPSRALATRVWPLSAQAAVRTAEGSIFQPIDQLNATQFARNVQWAIRKLVRHFVWSVVKWATWVADASVFLVAALLAPLFDRELLRTWRVRGFNTFRVSLTLALAVYVRLLIDGRSPLVGKALLALAIVYGMKGSDLVPDDWWTPVGWLDDFVAVSMASRFFMWLCPERLVEEHAVKAACAREKSIGERLSTDGPV